MSQGSPKSQQEEKEVEPQEEVTETVRIHVLKMLSHMPILGPQFKPLHSLQKVATAKVMKQIQLSPEQ